ncbi:SMP-30/gluconolactonase/LRE family protein [Marivirga salinae]|uniref:SMP-30/gluconolactonase/LRE family protein n=1 Tax=Marivirga salinarum TaxID=3059078 RepID=A0AA49JBT0_9BACT|nr:SMP-30/gluconolactonase/LRE family protein [Marivirga sp. BDSF4-3]WKK76508.2 SMP-30/gluconolactonase/LRE family protein [Marivirga sp. BDSF4-3]
MIDLIRFHVLIFSAFLFSGCDQQPKMPVSENTEVVKIAGDFDFTEGPTADSLGNVYFTDQPNNRIYKYSIYGELSVFTDSSGRSNGLYIDHNQNLWACADGQNQLWKFSLDGSKEIILNPSGDVVFNGPNDVWVHKNGNLYFTDPIYQRPYWENVHDTVGHQSVYLLKNGKPILLDSTLVQANGVVGNSEENLLFVADIGDNKTYRYKINEKGVLKDKMLFVEQGSDGMTLDSEGNLYLTGNGVDIYNRKGDFLQHLDIPEDWTANICFGGENFDQLFITASKSLYSVKTNVKTVR